jgi:hypothetical protein
MYSKISIKRVLDIFTRKISFLFSLQKLVFATLDLLIRSFPTKKKKKGVRRSASTRRIYWLIPEELFSLSEIVVHIVNKAQNWDDFT